MLEVFWHEFIAVWFPLMPPREKLRAAQHWPVAQVEQFVVSDAVKAVVVFASRQLPMVQLVA